MFRLSHIFEPASLVSYLGSDFVHTQQWCLISYRTLRNLDPPILGQTSQLSSLCTSADVATYERMPKIVSDNVVAVAGHAEARSFLSPTPRTQLVGDMSQWWLRSAVQVRLRRLCWSSQHSQDVEAPESGEESHKSANSRAGVTIGGAHAYRCRPLWGS